MAIWGRYSREVYGLRVCFPIYLQVDDVRLLDFAFLIIYGRMHHPDAEAGVILLLKNIKRYEYDCCSDCTEPENETKTSQPARASLARARTGPHRRRGMWRGRVRVRGGYQRKNNQRNEKAVMLLGKKKQRKNTAAEPLDQDPTVESDLIGSKKFRGFCSSRPLWFQDIRSTVSSAKKKREYCIPYALRD